jgi:hypothetical protein
MRVAEALIAIDLYCLNVNNCGDVLGGDIDSELDTRRRMNASVERRRAQNSIAIKTASIKKVGTQLREDLRRFAGNWTYIIDIR